jgi:hypothetical protein
MSFCCCWWTYSKNISIIVGKLLVNDNLSWILCWCFYVSPPIIPNFKRLINLYILIFFCMLILCTILRATLDKGPKSKVQWNQALLLVKSFKLVPRPLNKGPRPRKVKLWFNLHGIISKGKPISLDPKKELKGDFMVWKTKV